MAYANDTIAYILNLLNRAETALSKDEEREYLTTALNYAQKITDTYQRKNYISYIQEKLHNL